MNTIEKLVGGAITGTGSAFIARETERVLLSGGYIKQPLFGVHPDNQSLFDSHFDPAELAFFVTLLLPFLLYRNR
ncbi:MAG: hypothetical protein AAB439_01745 [Patescibacteria group bacterium]